MCVLSDFEALTPNLLARTIETVEGSGIIVLLLQNMTSLTQFYTMAMDIHDRFRTEAHAEVTPRFNERFLLSLASCPTCIVVDDELNILPISSHIRNIQPVEKKVLRSFGSREAPYRLIHFPQGSELSASEKELKALQESLKDTEPIGSLISKARTLEQAPC
jgi:N-acetyltransferase 10